MTRGPGKADQQNVGNSGRLSATNNALKTLIVLAP
jgi:hypothetical protein